MSTTIIQSLRISQPRTSDPQQVQQGLRGTGFEDLKQLAWMSIRCKRSCAVCRYHLHHNDHDTYYYHYYDTTTTTTTMPAKPTCALLTTSTRRGHQLPDWQGTVESKPDTTLLSSGFGLQVHRRGTKRSPQSSTEYSTRQKSDSKVKTSSVSTSRG